MTQTSWADAQDSRGAPTREFTIERPDRRPVTGAVWLPAELRAGAPIVACGHGASGDRYQTPIPHLAKRLTREAGFPVVSMDGPVHGLRQVGPGGREALAGEMQRPTMVDDMVEDWHLALDAVRALPGVGAGPLAYYGLSMGCLFGIPTLAVRDDVKVAVLGLLGTSGAGVASLADRLTADAARITCPVLYLMQLEDELFDRPGYLTLFDAIGSDDKRLHANPGLHPNVPYEELENTIEFLRAHLEGRAKREIIDPFAE